MLRHPRTLFSEFRTSATPKANWTLRRTLDPILWVLTSRLGGADERDRRLASESREMDSSSVASGDFDTYLPVAADPVSLFKTSPVILDSNVLLNLYRYPPALKSDLLRAFAGARERLWIPHHVFLEFHENRLDVVRANEKALETLQSEVSKLHESATGALKKSGVDGDRHPSFDSKAYLEKTNSFFESLKASISGELAGVNERASIYRDDSTLQEIQVLLKGAIGDPLADTLDLEKIGKERYGKKRPPGYEDEGKPDGFFSKGRYFPRRFGDLIIWLQILAKFQNTDSLFFVTDDEKEDWWHILGGKKTGPRRELREEAAEAGIKNLFFQTVSGFLHLSNASGETEIQPDSENLARRLSRDRVADGKQQSWRKTLRFELIPPLESEVMLLLSSDNVQHTVQLETVRRAKDLLMSCLDLLDTSEGVDGVFIEIKWSGAELLNSLLRLEREEFPDPRYRISTCRKLLSLTEFLRRRLDDSFVRAWGPPTYSLGASTQDDSER